MGPPQKEPAAEPQSRRRDRRCPGMIRLSPATRKNEIRPLANGIREEEFQFSNLVPRQTTTRQIIALDPNLFSVGSP